MSGSSLNIRDFHGEDFESLYWMDQVCFEEGIAFTRMEFAFYLSRNESITRIAESDGHIAGFILGCIEARRKGRMITLDVIPEFRRRGIGMALMKDMHSEFRKRNVKTSILEVAIGNTAAQDLYKRLGYQETDTLVGYYRGKEDAFRMQAVISG